MSKEEINLLKMQLYLNYYKNDITDRYVRVIDKIVLDNDVLNNLDERLYITTLDNYNKLQQRIDKAIEYIKTTNFWGLYDDTPMEEVKYGEELLEILKGSDNNENRRSNKFME